MLVRGSFDDELEWYEDEFILDPPLLGMYTQEERLVLLDRFRMKRKQRLFRRVRYVLRQKLSLTRPRCKGKFIKGR